MAGRRSLGTIVLSWERPNGLNETEQTIQNSRNNPSSRTGRRSQWTIVHLRERPERIEKIEQTIYKKIGSCSALDAV